MLRTSVIALLRHGSSPSLHYFTAGHRATASGSAILRALHSGCRNSATRSQWRSQTASRVYDKQFSTLKPDMLSPNINSMPQKEERKDVKGSVFVYSGRQSATVAAIQIGTFKFNCSGFSLAGLLVIMTSIFSSFFSIILSTPMPDSMGVLVLIGNPVPGLAFLSYVPYLGVFTICGLNTCANAFCWWFGTPYIHRLRWLPGSDRFEVDMISWLGKYTTRTIKLADIKPPRPLWIHLPSCSWTDYASISIKRPVSFVANGKDYYVEEEHFDNAELLAMLTPEEED